MRIFNKEFTTFVKRIPYQYVLYNNSSTYQITFKNKHDLKKNKWRILLK